MIRVIQDTVEVHVSAELVAKASKLLQVYPTAQMIVFDNEMEQVIALTGEDAFTLAKVLGSIDYHGEEIIDGD